MSFKRTYRKGKLFLFAAPWVTIFLPPFGKLGNSQKHITLYEGTYNLLLHKRGKANDTARFKVTIKPGTTVRPVFRAK